MKILLTGSRGALGQPLANGLVNAGHQVIGVSRNAAQVQVDMEAPLRVIRWDQLTTRFISSERIDAIISLAGAPMMQRWNARNKAAILQSRLATVRTIFGLVRQLPPHARPECVINVSSVSIYSSCALPVDEFSALRPDAAFFQSQVWLAVEHLVEKLHVPGVRTLITRLGLVIGADELLNRMLRLSRCYLGTILGNGQQRIGWISRQDLLRAYTCLLTNTGLRGVFNLVTPRPITAEQLGTGIARTVGRPVLLRVPPTLLKLLLGELARNFLTSADVMPARLQMAGFSWELPDLDRALQVAAVELGHVRPTGQAGEPHNADTASRLLQTDTPTAATIR